jgi:hypothetical protein
MTTYKQYRTATQLAISATQQLCLVPFDDLIDFLMRSIEVSGAETELEQEKLVSAYKQMQFLILAGAYAKSVRDMLEALEE